MLRFSSESTKYPDIKQGIIDEFDKNLLKKRRKFGEVARTIPKGLDKLPLPIQRHLAREGHYLEYIITHRHHLIAFEALRYININNIERLMRYINRMNINLIRRVLDRNELFRKNSLIVDILNSPKSNVQFAVKHSFKLSKNQLLQIARNPNSNPEVRNYVKSLLRNKFKEVMRI